MKPKTRFYTYTVFLLLSVLCLGGSIVMCLIEPNADNLLTAAIFLCCAVTFVYLLGQMIRVND